MSDGMINIASLAIFGVALAVGQILFKHTGLAIRGQPILDGLLLLARQPAVYAALALYGFATLLRIWILSRMPVMQAHPWAAAAMALVPIMGWYIFDERVTPLFWVGVALILAGILLTQYAYPTAPDRGAAAAAGEISLVAGVWPQKGGPAAVSYCHAR